MERHLWLNLSKIRERDKSFLQETLLSPPCLLGDTVNAVVERFQEAKKETGDRGGNHSEALPRADRSEDRLPIAVQVSGPDARGHIA